MQSYLLRRDVSCDALDAPRVASRMSSRDNLATTHERDHLLSL